MRVVREVAIVSPCLQVLATGLSALYSELPTSADITLDEWQSVLPVIEGAVPELKRFTQALSFCNSVLQVCVCVCVKVRERMCVCVKERECVCVCGCV